MIIGVDEAGRGPLAGPIAVGVFAVKAPEILNDFDGVKESKQLSSIQRDEWFEKIKERQLSQSINFAVSFCNADVIDQFGLTRVTKALINRCLKRLEASDFIDTSGTVLLDGLLHAPSRYSNQQTIIDGDSKERIIALASICAKVLRDRKMIRLGREYPEYGFEIHKGYGTAEHYEAIRKHGLSPIHRRSFLKNVIPDLLPNSGFRPAEMGQIDLK